VQERKEAKRQMCLISTEKAVELGARKDRRMLSPQLVAYLLSVRSISILAAGPMSARMKVFVF